LPCEYRGMDQFAHLLESARPTAIGMTFGFAFMTALELLIPRTKQSAAGRIQGLFFWILWIPATAISFAAFRALWAAIGIPPLIVLPLDFSWAGVLAAAVLAPLAGAFVGDFFFYWFHRGQHAFFWRFHAVHHSIRDMNAVNAFHHPSEGVIQALLYLLPTSLIVADTGPAVPMMTVLIYFQASFIHSPAAIHLGPLRHVLVDNRFHRIHHSLQEEHFDRNFGAFTTFWDRLFGTAWWPAREEWPDTGLAEVDQPRNVREWVTLPWRFGRPEARPVPELPDSPAMVQ
jgi:sterol desaturase/sphingolipid hydroxylase (fatty acid hydroxylase superfamily)